MSNDEQQAAIQEARERILSRLFEGNDTSVCFNSIGPCKADEKYRVTLTKQDIDDIQTLVNHAAPTPAQEGGEE